MAKQQPESVALWPPWYHHQSVIPQIVPVWASVSQPTPLDSQSSPSSVSKAGQVLLIPTPGAARSTDAPPSLLDAAILFAPVGSLVPEALSRVSPGGVVVCAGIHMTDIPSFPYRILWEERMVRSVANLTREDAREFLALAERIHINTSVQAYPLADANRALADLRGGHVTGAAVLVP